MRPRLCHRLILPMESHTLPIRRNGQPCGIERQLGNQRTQRRRRLLILRRPVRRRVQHIDLVMRQIIVRFIDMLRRVVDIARRRMPRELAHREPARRHLPRRHRLRSHLRCIEQIELRRILCIQVSRPVIPIHRLRNDPHIALMLLRLRPVLFIGLRLRHNRRLA